MKRISDSALESCAAEGGVADLHGPNGERARAERAEADAADLRGRLAKVQELHRQIVEEWLWPIRDYSDKRKWACELRDAAYGDAQQPSYDPVTHSWTPQCPHGDACTACDALGYCTREEIRSGGDAAKETRTTIQQEEE